MKEKWADEQLETYKGLSIDEIKDKIFNDLLSAIKWVKYNDFESAYRMANGAVKAMFENQEKILNSE